MTNPSVSIINEGKIQSPNVSQIREKLNHLSPLPQRKKREKYPEWKMTDEGAGTCECRTNSGTSLFPPLNFFITDFWKLIWC